MKRTKARKLVVTSVVLTMMERAMEKEEGVKVHGYKLQYIVGIHALRAGAHPGQFPTSDLLPDGLNSAMGRRSPGM